MQVCVHDFIHHVDISEVCQAHRGWEEVQECHHIGVAPHVAQDLQAAVGWDGAEQGGAALVGEKAGQSNMQGARLFTGTAEDRLQLPDGQQPALSGDSLWRWAGAGGPPCLFSLPCPAWGAPEFRAGCGGHPAGC